MANRVYVNNIPWTVSEETLAAHFTQVGAVTKAEIFYNPYNNRSKGCAIVTFESEDSAARAIAELNEVELQDRPLHIREDRGEAPPREPREPREAREPRELREARPPRPVIQHQREPREMRQTSRPDDTGRKVFVGNLSWRTDWQSLKDLFKDCGDVIRADVAKNPEGRSRGFGTVVFTTEESAQNAIEMKNNLEFEGRAITVRLDKFC